MLSSVSKAMRKRCCLALTGLLLATSATCRVTEPISKERALARIDACLQKNEASARECADLKANINVLIDAYKSNDKSVLPALLRFDYLTDFFDDALLSDPGGFLSTVGALSRDRQNAVFAGMAGPQFGTLPRERFLAIKAALEDIPSDSPNRSIAETCLKSLKEHNASLFIDYFPPDTFTGPTAVFITDWYSRVLYGLGEKSLWRETQDTEETWRFTHIGAFSSPRTVTLTIHSDGTGSVCPKLRDETKGDVQMGDPVGLSAKQVDHFLAVLGRAKFWTAPTQIQSRGHDGAEWVLEGTKQGQYHIVTRWCPGPESPEVLAFAEACRLLLEYAGQPYKGSC